MLQRFYPNNFEYEHLIVVPVLLENVTWYRRKHLYELWPDFKIQTVTDT